MTVTDSILGLFPGQGSQKVGMGKELWEKFDFAKELFSIADGRLGFSLSQICFEGPAEELTRTEITQPALLTVSTICHQLLSSRTGSLPIAAAAGHSLGEYSALVAAGALRFEDAVMLVHKRGKFMQEAVPVGEGKMVAVLGSATEDIEAALEKVTAGTAQIANINAPGQVVVAGHAPAVDEFLSIMGDPKSVVLPVSAPFHTELMQPAADQLRRELDQTHILEAAYPVYANYSARPVKAPEEIREALALQVCGRVRWVECMQNAIADVKPSCAVEFGAGNVLAGLLKRIDKTLPRLNVNSAESADAVAEKLG